MAKTRKKKPGKATTRRLEQLSTTLGTLETRFDQLVEKLGK
jgi:hypothetical protein